MVLFFQNNVDKAAVTKQIPLKATVSFLFFLNFINFLILYFFQGGNEQEAELRRAVDDNKRLQSKLQQLEQENEQLRVSF